MVVVISLPAGKTREPGFDVSLPGEIGRHDNGAVGDELDECDCV